MGEIANDMINGVCCSLCGQYFKDPNEKNTAYEHGYPVVCGECWEDLDYLDQETHQKAEVITF